MPLPLQMPPMRQGYVTMEHLEDGVARAIVANAGNANACAPDGMENARRMAKAAAQLLGVAETDVAVASTGVIGQRLNIECIEEHLPELKLEDNASEKANRAIMTTDTKPKTAAVEFTIGGKTCRISSGSYAGNGKTGQSNPSSLTFDFTPVLVVIIRKSSPGTHTLFVRPNGYGPMGDTMGTITWGEKKVSWYCQNPQVAGDVQMNMSGSTYYYVGLGY